MNKIKLSELKKLEWNPRTIKKEDLDKLTKSIEKFWIIEWRPFLVSNRTGENVIIWWNQRYEVCKKLGIKEVPVHIMEGLTEEEEREIIIRDNISNGEWDWDILANEWDKEELEEWWLDVQFETVEPEAEEDDFDVPEGGIETDIVLGDLFEIGEHRLLCGDSTDSDSVAKLMNGEKADMVFTDPPYGIKVVSNSSVGGGGALKFDGKPGKVVQSTKGFSEIIGDDTTETARCFYNTCISLGFKNYIIWGGNYFTDFLPPSMGWIVWYKKNTGNFADFEMAWTSFNKASRLYEYLWNGLSREGSRALELVKRVHPTQKPVGLSIQILQNYDCNIIFDGFLGSGTTMVASHQLKRKCYGMELDPKYVQTIINRMIKLDSTLEIKRNWVPYTITEISDK